GGEFWIAFKGARVVPLSDDDGDEVVDEEDWRRRLRIPELWDEQFAGLEKQEYHQGVTRCIAAAADGGMNEQRESDTIQKMPHDWGLQGNIITTRGKTTLTLSNLFYCNPEQQRADEQMRVLAEDIRRILLDHERTPGDIVFTTILLRSMQDFAAVNGVYAKLFTKPNPPARVTVACGNALPHGGEIMLSLIIDLGPREARQGLHVQSRSYWAPANIGPYSQAVSVPIPNAEEDSDQQASLVYVAGQIPLVPASMRVLQVPELENQDPVGAALAAFWKQTCLSLQHLWRIGGATGITWWAYGVAFIAGEDHIGVKAKLAALAWEKVHDRSIWEHDDEDDEDSPDVWDKKYGGQGSFAVEIQEHRLPDFESLTLESSLSSEVPSFFAAQVDELPQSCSVEWQGLGTATSNVSLHSFLENDMDIQQCTVGNKHWTVSACSIPGSASDQDLECMLSQLASKSGDKSSLVIYTARTWLMSTVKAQIMPCRSVWGKDGSELAAAVLVRTEGS
ncbi:MAG: hypothetical protein Q9191_008255, partial [Dirinaria sp. TL-2023a]